jgi:hypothetical protein
MVMVKARLGAPAPQFKGNRRAFSRNIIRYAVNRGFWRQFGNSLKANFGGTGPRPHPTSH